MTSVKFTNRLLDVNECLVNDSCHFNATCNNTDGSYICTCDSGYSGNGHNCTGENRRISIALKKGRKALSNVKFQIFSSDINECQTDTPCHSNAWCNNTDGSYTCECVPGYSGDGFNCTGKNF